MAEKFSRERYEEEVRALFLRFPSVQNVPFNEAYKPGLGHMLSFCEILGHPEREFRAVHVAGTNGKGSVSNMLAAAISAHGNPTGLFTSPHILDFRERMRISDGTAPARLIPEEYVYAFILKYKKDFEALSLSFFEITTGMAFRWFADMGCTHAVIEVGLGGRLDSTNVLTPELSVITSIGLDHCDMLGHTLAAIAGEKAGIIKKGVPVVIGESNSETRPVFVAAAEKCGSRIVFAEETEPSLWKDAAGMEEAMDLHGLYQRKNLRTAAAALDVLGLADRVSEDAMEHTAERMGFHGRWEKLSDKPLVICDIGHNAHALKNNFAQLEEMMASGRYDSLTIVYSVMADKDFDSIMPLMPKEAVWHFAAPSTRRAMPAEQIRDRYAGWLASRGESAAGLQVYASVREAVEDALRKVSDRGLIYIGGSTFAVSEALPVFIRP